MKPDGITHSLKGTNSYNIDRDYEERVRIVYCAIILYFNNTHDNPASQSDSSSFD